MKNGVGKMHLKNWADNYSGSKSKDRTKAKKKKGKKKQSKRLLMF
jgi:hypothetical protein